MNVDDNYHPNIGSKVAFLFFEIVLVFGLIAALIGYNPDHTFPKEN